MPPMVMQLQTMMNRRKLEAGCLLNFHASIGKPSDLQPPSGASASSSSDPAQHLRNTVGTSWWVLGATSLRPLCHVFMKVTPHLRKPRILVPVLQAGSAVLASSYEILHFYAKAAVQREDVPEVRISSHPYKVISGPQNGEFLELIHEQPQEIHVGPNVQLPPPERKETNRQSASLPCGLQLPSKSRSSNAPQKRDKADKVVDEQEGKSGKRKSASKAAVAPAGSVPEGVEVDPFAGEVELTSAEAQQLEFARALERAAEAAELTKPPAGKRPPDELPPAGAEPPVAKSRFHKTLGLVGYSMAKRAWTCASCKSKMTKGTPRFELAYNLQKPSQSWHEECLLSMPSNLRPPSCDWLTKELSLPSLPESARPIFEAKLADLNALQSIG